MNKSSVRHVGHFVFASVITTTDYSFKNDIWTAAKKSASSSWAKFVNEKDSGESNAKKNKNDFDLKSSILKE